VSERPNERRETEPVNSARDGRSRRSEGIVVAAVPLGEISALREGRIGSARYVVEIAGRPSVTVSAELVDRLGLKVGGQVDQALAGRLANQALELAVFDKAVALLAVRARSVRDLSQRLRRVGARPSDIGAAIARLTELGLLNDASFARALAESRVQGGGVSRRRVEQELQRRGVDRTVAQVAVGETLQELNLDEEGAAMIVARKRMRVLKSCDLPTRKQRLIAFLARRGYEPDVVRRVVRAVLLESVPEV